MNFLDFQPDLAISTEKIHISKANKPLDRKLWELELVNRDVGSLQSVQSFGTGNKKAGVLGFSPMFQPSDNNLVYLFGSKTAHLFISKEGSKSSILPLHSRSFQANPWLSAEAKVSSLPEWIGYGSKP